VPFVLHFLCALRAPLVLLGTQSSRRITRNTQSGGCTKPIKLILDRPLLIKNKLLVMYATYHLASAQEITTDVVEAIKAAFKSKPIKITVEAEDDETAFLLGNPANKAMLLKSIEQDKNGQSTTANIQD
jgi:hypothetical protein